MLAPVFVGRAQAEAPVKGEVKVTTDGGFARLVFRFEKEVPASIELTYPIMVVTFKKPVDDRGRPSQCQRAGLHQRRAARSRRHRDPHRAQARKVKLNSIPAAERLYVDLLPENWTGIMPGLPQEVVDGTCHAARAKPNANCVSNGRRPRQKKPQAIRVKVATQPTFTRYVFAMPDMANVVPERADGKLTLDFDQPIKWDLADAKAALPPTLQSIDADIEDDSTSVTFRLQRHAAGAHVPRGPQHRGRCRT